MPRRKSENLYIKDGVIVKRSPLPKWLYWKASSPYIQYKFTITKPDGTKEVYWGSTQTDDRKLAEAMVLVFHADAVRGIFQPVSSKITLGDLAKRYLNLCKLQPAVVSKVGYFKNIFSFPKFNPKKQASAVTTEECIEYQTWRLGRVCIQSVNKELATLRNMYNVALKKMKLKLGNPVQDVEFPNERKFRRDRYMTDEEKKLIFTDPQYPEYYRAIALFAAKTGIRQGEIRDLKWTDIDFEQGLIRVVAGKEDHTRYVPMHPYVMEILSRLPRSGEYVFCQPDGSKLSRFGSIITAFKRSCNRNKIQNLRFHDLRHSFASDCREAGIGLDRLQIWLGHQSRKMTERYAHIKPKLQKIMNAEVMTLLPEPWYPKEQVFQPSHATSVLRQENGHQVQ